MSDPYATNPTFKYSHQAGSVASVVLKTGPGILHSVTWNTVGATPGTVTLADSATATTTPAIAISAPIASSAGVSMIYDIGFANGLAYTAATATTADVTVSYI